MTLDDVFKPNGLLATHFPDYEQRTGQVQMARTVETAIKSGFGAVIEGATGVGKGYGYLIPIILSGSKAIISTSNKSLQDQLSNKDLPALKKALPIDFNWVVLKGKNNYFCHEHFKSNEKEIRKYFVKEGLTATEITLKLKNIIAWVQETKHRDIEFYPDELPKAVKELITCDSSTIHEKGSTYAELCYATKARLAAKQAQIVLVNHTLLTLDISLRSKTDGKATILPKADVIVIDEAHTFDRYAALAFSDEISWFSLHHLLNWTIVKRSMEWKELKQLSTLLETNLNRFLPEKSANGYYKQQKFSKFDGFESVITLLHVLIDKVENNEKFSHHEVDRIKVKEISREAKNLIKRLETLSQEDENMLRWVEARDHKGQTVIRLKSVPIDISSLLNERLFKNQVVICTSATLAVNRSFDFFRLQVGMPETALELIVDSPFNFKENALIYISKGEREKYWEIQQLLTYSKGRAFVLFMSYYEMKRIYDMINIPYPKMIQSEHISRVQLLDSFRNTPNAVLFGTRSFWEGVDVKGDGLVIVIIDKLPFENPSDLLYSSKIEKIDKKLGKGKHWFRFTIPDACLKLKQGVGRLIRSTTDIGVIALLDSRINYRSYGKTVLASLPPAYRTQQLEKVERFYQKWNR